MRVRANVIANFAGQGWTALMSILFVPLYIQLLGIEAFALIGFFTMVQFWLALLDMGILPTTTREMARYTSGSITVESIRDLLRSFELICFGIGLMIAAAFGLAAGYLANDWFNADHLAPATVAKALALIGAVTAIRLGEGFYRSCLIGLQRQVWLSAAVAAIATLRGGGAVLVLLWIDRSIESFFVWQGLVSAASVALLGVKAYRLLPKPSRPARFSKAPLRQVGRFAAGMMAIQLLAILLLQVDKILLSRMLPLAGYGYYMLASTIASLLYAFTTPITQAVYPALVERVASGDRTAESRVFTQASQLTTAIIVPPALALLFFTQSVLFAWTGDLRVADATASIAAPLILGTLFHCLTQMPFYLQLAHGWTTLSIRLNLFSVAVLVPTLFLMVPRYGAIGAAWTWVGLTSFYLITIGPLTLRRLLPETSLRSYVRDAALPAVPAVAVMMLARCVPIQDQGRICQGAFVTLAGGIALACALLALQPVRDRIRSILTKGLVPPP